MTTHLPTFSAATPRFFTVILHNTLRDKRLLIPRKFVRRHGKTLSSDVFVKLPCGSEWKMGVRKSDDKGSLLVWLSEGWPEFAKHYSLQIGHFLVFCYQGNSRFDAFIFDRTTVEIDYPRTVVVEDKDEDEEESVEILEDFPRCSRPQKKQRTNPIGQNQARPRVTHSGQSNIEKPENSMTKSDESTFRVVMKPTHVITQYKLSLPLSFSRKFFTDESCDAILKLSDDHGKYWPFKVVGSNGDKIPARFRKDDWKKFSEDNDLKVDDICTFELVDINTMSFHVSISREASDDLSTHPSDGEFRGERANPVCIYSGYSSAFEEARRFSSKNPFFVYNVTKSNLKRFPRRVPGDFGRNHFGTESRAVILESRQKSWSATVSHASPHWYNFTGNGWFTFVKDNSLRHGDICIFELINKDPFVLRATIFRVMRCSVQPKSVEELEPHRRNDLNVETVPSSPRKLLLPNRFFNVEMQSSVQNLNVPRSFGRIHFEKITQDVTLQVENKTWVVKMIAYSDRHVFSAGWRAFAKDNNLQTGDSCVFELVCRQMDNVVLKVAVYRSI